MTAARVASQGRRFGVALAVSLLGLWLWAASAQAAATASNGDLVILLDSRADLEDVGEEVREVGGRIVASIPQIRAYLVDLPGSGAVPTAVLARLAEFPGVRNASAVAAVSIAETEVAATLNDPNLGSAWHIPKINAPLGWDTTLGSSAVKIAIVDTGVDYTHPDLAGKVTLGPDYGSGDSDPKDTQGHGTHVAGIAAATGNNGVGSAGVCPACQIVAIKVFPDGSGSTYDFPIAQGITWAADNGARVINLSLGGPGASSVTRTAVDYAWSKGVVVVAAAGNSATSTPHYPAAFPNAIAVGSTTSSDALSSFSNFGSWVDLTAPGSSIYATLMGGAYGLKSGTSMATPVVAGAAGLAFSGLQAPTGSSVRAALEAAVVDLGAAGYDTTFGHGRIDLSKLFTGAPAPSGPPATPVAVETSSLPSGVAGSPYSAQLSATGGTTPYTWTRTSGTLPSGLTLNGSTGAITGTPTSAVTATLTFRVTDAGGQTASRSLVLTIRAPLVVTTSSLPSGYVGIPYSSSLAASGGLAPYSWSLASGSLPSGLTLGSTGAITGVPETEESASVTVQVTDATGATATRTLVVSTSVVPPVDLSGSWSSVRTYSTRVTGTFQLSLTGASLPRVTVRFQVVSSSGQVLAQGTTTVSSLKPGTRSISVRLSVRVRSGYTLRADIDPADAVAEADELNNRVDRAL